MYGWHASRSLALHRTHPGTCGGWYKTSSKHKNEEPHTHMHQNGHDSVDVSEKRPPPDTKLISKLEDANDWPTRNRQHQARTHTAPQTDGLQDHTSTRIPLSHSMSLRLYLCHPSNQILTLSQSVLFSNSWYLTLSVVFTHCLSPSFALSIVFLSFCLPVIFLSLTNSVHVRNLQVVTVHLQQQTLAINEIPNN